MKKWPSLFLFTLCLSTFLFSQNQVDTVGFNGFKHEIALDFQNAFRNQINGDATGGTAIATSLMYRRHIQGKNGKARALRLQVGGSYNLPLGSQEVFSNGNTGNNNLLVTRNQEVDVFAFVGLESQRQINRLQFYSGIDLGVGYFREVGVVNVSTSFSGNVNFYREGRDITTSIHAVGFFGVKYFLHPRFSMSYEASMTNSLRFRREMIDRYIPTQEDPVEREFNYKRTEIGLGFDYLRYFNLSYYF